MASKTGKRANKAGGKIAAHMTTKDDGSRWIVVNAKGEQVYPGPGAIKQIAEHLSEGLVQETSLVEVV